MYGKPVLPVLITIIKVADNFILVSISNENW